MACKNIELSKNLLEKYTNGDGQGYINGCSNDFKGKIFSGLIPGGENINGKEELKELFTKMPEYIEGIKFEELFDRFNETPYVFYNTRPISL